MILSFPIPRSILTFLMCAELQLMNMIWERQCSCVAVARANQAYYSALERGQMQARTRFISFAKLDLLHFHSVRDL